MYCVLGAEPLVCLIKIIQAFVLQCSEYWRKSPWCIWSRLFKRVWCRVQCVGGRALGVSDQDYPSVCAAMYYVLGGEPLMYLIRIIQGCVLPCTVCGGKSPWCIWLRLSKRVCCCVLCVGRIALGVSDLDYPSICAAVNCVFEGKPLVYLIKIIQVCVLLCTVCWGKSPWCIWSRLFNCKRVCCSVLCVRGRALRVSDQ